MRINAAIEGSISINLISQQSSAERGEENFALTPDTQSDKIEEINSNSIMKEREKDKSRNFGH